MTACSGTFFIKMITGQMIKIFQILDRISRLIFCVHMNQPLEGFNSIQNYMYYLLRIKFNNILSFTISCSHYSNQVSQLKTCVYF